MKRLTLSIAVVFLSMAAFSAQASPVPTKILADEADLVFKGKVTDIAYKNSEAGIPHTFVTYTISEVISGDYSDRTLTLRFEGGIDEKGLAYLVSNLPTFDVGDEDILFVKGNGEMPCPLAGCTKGRIRIISGVLQDEHGYVLHSDSATEYVTIGDRIPSTAVDTYSLGNAVFTMVHPKTEITPAKGKEKPPTKATPPRLTEKAIKDKTKSHAANKAKANGSVATVITGEPKKLNADINMSFKGLAYDQLSEIPSGKAQMVATQAIVMSPEEEFEVRQREIDTATNNTAFPELKFYGNPDDLPQAHPNSGSILGVQ